MYYGSNILDQCRRFLSESLIRGKCDDKLCRWTDQNEEICASFRHGEAISVQVEGVMFQLER